MDDNYRNIKMFNSVFSQHDVKNIDDLFLKFGELIDMHKGKIEYYEINYIDINSDNYILLEKFVYNCKGIYNNKYKISNELLLSLFKFKCEFLKEEKDLNILINNINRINIIQGKFTEDQYLYYIPLMDKCKGFIFEDKYLSFTTINEYIIEVLNRMNNCISS